MYALTNLTWTLIRNAMNVDCREAYPELARKVCLLQARRVSAPAGNSSLIPSRFLAPSLSVQLAYNRDMFVTPPMCTSY
jgi:hypothetical protein